MAKARAHPYIMQALLLALPAASLLLLSATLPRGPAARAGAKACGHILLFTSARHGSTWLLDSAERCRYSRAAGSSGAPFAADVFRRTEPWKHAGNYSRLDALTGAQAGAHLAANSSLKIFSSTMARSRDRVAELARDVGRRGVPVVVLRRRLRDAFRSLKVAQHSRVWNGRSRSVALAAGVEEGLVQEEAFLRYEKGMEGYYRGVYRMLEEAGVRKVDTVHYEAIRERAYIRLEKSGCYIRNCNFG